MPHPTHRYLIWLAALVVLLIALIAISGYAAFQPPQNGPSPATASSQPDHSGMRIPPPQPPPTPADTVEAQNAHPFQFLISYVDSGFEPQSATIKAGDTVRFTNNSTGQLWVAASGSQLYPAVQNGCGSSALDSCQPLQPGYYWQFTFTKAGTWDFVNNLDKTKTGAVVVQVK